MSKDVKSKVVVASKWSLLTEMVAKVMSPIVNMVLARLLTPEAFGMVATVTMVTSFADLFTDAGFQKYLVQHDFIDEDDYRNSSCVAFWANFITSILLWVIIAIYREQIAIMVGNPGLGDALIIGALSLPITAFSSIQTARHKRSFDFQTLFFVRLVAIIIPLIVTIPLALLLHSYWALIIGNLCVRLSNAIILTIKSSWKPKSYFNFAKLKEMLNFSVWTLLEQLLGWANLNVGIFIVGAFLNSHYLGMYKTSMSSVNQIMEILVNAFSPILLSTLSRLKDEKDKFLSFFYSFEEKIGLIVIPLGVGIFVYRDLFTSILLGNQWSEAAEFIGLWALMRALLIVFGKFSMEVLVALGKPKYSVLAQALELIVLIPVLIITAELGYSYLYVARSLVVLWSSMTKMLILKMVVGISPQKVIARMKPYLIAAIIMGGCGYLFINLIDNYIWHFISVFICIIVYFVLLTTNTKARDNIKELVSSVTNKRNPT